MREKAGLSEQNVQLPAAVSTVEDMFAWQRSRGVDYVDAFAVGPSIVRVAIDQQNAKPHHRMTAAREIASPSSPEADAAVIMQAADLDIDVEDMSGEWFGVTAARCPMHSSHLRSPSGSINHFEEVRLAVPE